MQEEKVSSPQGTAWRRRGKIVRFGLWTLLVVLILAGGYGYWYTHRPQPPNREAELFPGVRYYRVSRRAPRPMVIHVVTVELDRPGVSLLVTPGDPAQPRPLRARTTSQFLKEFRLQIAVNGDFFFPWWSHAPWDFYPHVGDPVELEGLAISNGVLYSSGGERWQFPVLYFTRKNRGVFNRIPDDVYNAISGNVMLLEDGRLTRKVAMGREYLDPRTAVALDRDSRKLILIVIDGRQPNYSEGATLRELAQILQDYGAYHALNLDGGGSTTLVVEDKNGEPSILNSPIDCRIPGRERPVANHFGVFVDAR